MGILGVNHLHKTNPWVAAWWSAALPGFGHMQMGMYLKGAVFLTAEIMLNLFGNINLAMLYTFTFQFEKAGQLINYDCAFLYVSIWVFSILDSYRLAVEVNKIQWLESKQKDHHFENDVISFADMNFLDKRNPWVSLFWSSTFTGLGHVYCHKILFGFILISWTCVITFSTHFPMLIIYTLTGQLDKIADAVNYEWLLFLPSVYFFGIYHGYSSTTVHNLLFKEEQAYYFQVNYGSHRMDIV
jgi:hypothetical protein